MSDFVARFCTLQFSLVRVFSDSRNVQKSVTRIIYLGPLPTPPLLHPFGLYYGINVLCNRPIPAHPPTHPTRPAPPAPHPAHRERGVSAVWRASLWRRRGVTAAWNWRFVLVDALGFVLVEVIRLVRGVTVDSFEVRCQLVSTPEAKRKL